MPDTVNLVAEIKKFKRTSRDESFAVDVSCIITNKERYRSKMVDTILLKLNDESGDASAVFRKNQCDQENWDSARTLRIGDTVRIKGVTTTGLDQADIICSSAQKLSNLKIVGTRITASKDSISAVTQVYVARLKHALAMTLRESGYSEIDTRMISSAPPFSGGVYPLKIHYDGYGGQFHISPTPVPQLIRFASRTTFDSLFSISRSFTQTYRDPVASVESVIISIFKRGLGIGDCLEFANAQILKILIDHAPDGVPVFHQGIPKRGAYFRFEHAEKAVSEPEIQVFDMADETGQIMGRLCWPSKIENIGHFSEYVLAEGFAVGPADNPAFSVISINIDRVFNLLFDDADIRRIPDLSSNFI